MFRSEHPDYGIDGEVEVFDDTGASTGLRFYVQLKATDGTVEHAQSVRLTLDVGRYYHDLDLPVLVVSYHSPSKALYARWFQEINPPDDSHRQETLVVKLDDENRWTDATPKHLVRDLSQRRVLRSGAIAAPILIALQIEAPNVNAAFVDELSSALAPLRGVAELTTDVDRALATVLIRDHKIVAWLGKECSRSMSIPKEVTNHRALAADTLLLLAWALGHAHQYSLAAKIALAVVDSSIMIQDPEVFVPLARYLARGHRLTDALDLSDRLATKFGSVWAAEAFRALALVANGLSAGELTLYEKYLDRRIELAQGAGPPQQIAMAYYNRGNHRRARGRHREAVHDYVLAGRTDPLYWDRDYFCSELGGQFFLLHRFRCASTLYERSVAKGAGLETKALLADALMFAGQYERAKGQFEAYLAETKELSPEWRLKDWALTEITKRGFVNQTRQTRAALPYAGNPSTLDDALRLDALCGLAWFNKGAAALAAKDRRAALPCYLLAAVCRTSDLQAWRNAFALAKEHEEDRQLAPWILMAAYEVNGEQFLEELAGASLGPSESTREYIQMLRRGLDGLPRRPTTREIRVLGPDSEYVTFDLVSGALTHRGRDLPKRPGSE